VSANSTYSVCQEIVAISANVRCVAQVDGTGKVAQVRRRSFSEQVASQHLADQIGHGPARARRKLLRGVMLFGCEIDRQALTSDDIMMSCLWKGRGAELGVSGAPAMWRTAAPSAAIRALS
jgi:hypothetical protein